MALFRKKPVVIEAMQLGFKASDLVAVCEWLIDNGVEYSPGLDGIVIPTLEGKMLAGHGDWIIKGVKGEFYPCKSDIFEATYEPVAVEWVG